MQPVLPANTSCQLQCVISQLDAWIVPSLPTHCSITFWRDSQCLSHYRGQLSLLLWVEDTPCFAISLKRQSTLFHLLLPYLQISTEPCYPSKRVFPDGLQWSDAWVMLYPYFYTLTEIKTNKRKLRFTLICLGLEMSHKHVVPLQVSVSCGSWGAETHG